MTDTTALSITELQQKAQEGDAQAQLNLAYRLSAGEGMEKNQILAFQWLNSAAELGNSEAQLALGLCCYIHGIFELWDSNTIISQSMLNFIEENKQKKISIDDFTLSQSWIQKSAEQGNGIAQYLLAMRYIYQDSPIEFNGKLHYFWLEKAAENGIAKAQLVLAHSYSSSQIEEKRELALKCLEKAAISGLAEAQYELAYHYLNGNGVEHNVEVAIEWLTKYIEHEQGDKVYCVCWLLGGLYAEGKGVQQNYELAIKWYEKAAEIIHAEVVENNRLISINEQFKFDIEHLKKGKAIWSQVYSEAKTRLADCLHKQATRSGITSKQAYEWHKKAAENGHAESQYWLSRYYLSGDVCEQLDEQISHTKRYSKAGDLAYGAEENGCAEANLVLGFLMRFDINDCGYGGDSPEAAIRAFKEAVGRTEQGIAEYFLAEYYRHSNDEKERELAEHYAEQSDLEKVWLYFGIDKLLEIDNSLRDKIQVLLKDSKLIEKNRDLQKLTEQLRLEIEEKEKAHKALHDKEREMLSFFTHTMRNALAAAPESLRQAIRLLGSDGYEHNANLCEAIDNIASLFSSLTLIDCLVDTFKQSISDPQEFKQAWESDHTGEATPQWVIASSLRHALHRIFFSSSITGLKRLLSHTEETSIEAARKLFIDEVLPLDVDHESVNQLYSWVNTNLQCINVAITDSDGIKFGANGTRFSLLFAITSELIINALKYWDGEDKIKISWKLVENEFFVFSVENHCKANATSNLAGTHKGLAFIKRLIELLGGQACFSCKVENGVFVAELMFNQTLFGVENERIMD